MSKLPMTVRCARSITEHGVFESYKNKLHNDKTPQIFRKYAVEWYRAASANDFGVHFVSG